MPFTWGDQVKVASVILEQGRRAAARRFWVHGFRVPRAATRPPTGADRRPGLQHAGRLI